MRPDPPELLVPVVDGADAGVYQVAPEVAIVQSADFFPPMLEDPAAFGRIAAVNALSDIYAVGGRPITAINLLAMPRDEPHARVATMLASAQEVVEDAGAVMLGGHTIIDREIKFGLSVTGVVHPERIVRHNTPRIGDALLLTKPIGTGIYVTAFGKGLIDEAQLAVAITGMQRSNRTAGLAMFELGASACTDITGFGLVGHALDMLSSVEASYEISYDALPLLPQSKALAESGAVCGGTSRNLDAYGSLIHFGGPGSLSPAQQVVLNDAQTSGGLLIALPAAAAEQLLALLHEAGEAGAAIIGRVTAQREARIIVT